MTPTDDTAQYRNTFRRLLEDKRFLGAIFDSVVAGEAEALNDQRYGDLSIRRGMMAFLMRDRQLSTSLKELGWRPQEEQKQRRIVAPEGMYGVGLQLLHSRAVISPNTAFTNVKGDATVELIGDNYRMCSGQTSLFEDAQNDDPRIAVWVLSMVSRDDIVRVALLLPEVISDCRRYLSGSLFFAGFPAHDLRQPVLPLADLPQGVDIEFPAFLDREQSGEPDLDLGEDI